MNTRFVFAAVASLMLVACGGSQQESQTEQPATQEQSIVLQPGPIGGGKCGSNTCASNQFCCNASCGTCAPLGGGCTQQACLQTPDKDEAPAAIASSTEEASIIGQPCGSNVCGSGTYCCNASCGTCVAKGDSCTQQVCSSPTAAPEPTNEASITLEQPCGSSVCGTGTYCCNASCGICAPKGASCTQQYCPPEV